MKISIPARSASRHVAFVASIFALVAGSMTLQPANAKDLYVSTTGNDSVSYAANDISNPWGTLDYALMQVMGGDTLYIRGGTYTPAGMVVIPRGRNGTAANPTRITNYPGEAVTIDNTNVTFEYIRLDGVSYWEISNLEFINARMAVDIALTFASDYNVMRNNRVVMDRGGDNIAAFRLGPNAHYTVIDGNEVIGPGLKADGFPGNTSCVYMDRVENVKVLNNRLIRCIKAIHYKHAPFQGGGTGIEYAYNYFENNDASLAYNGNNGHIHDNIFGPNAGQAIFCMDNGGPGGNGNTIDHNTFWGGLLYIAECGPLGAPQDNIVTNNLFMPVQPWDSFMMVRFFPAAHNTTTDFNLYHTNATIYEFTTRYDLAAWRTYYGQSANSIQADPVFSSPTPTSPDDYRLASGSPGVGAASDGTDMGARIDLFGSSGLTLVRPNSPQSLVVN